MDLPQLDSVELAIESLCQSLLPIDDEQVTQHQALSRILSQPLTADRDSPPLDVSAMDGYAIRMADIADRASDLTLKVTGVAYAGHAPFPLQTGTCAQIFTGGCVPEGADCVICREDTTESPGYVTLNLQLKQPQAGQNIRRRGENIKRGEIVLAAGTEIDTSSIGALATFGAAELRVRRLLRVSLLTTGDELIESGGQVQPWQIRDSNGPTLRMWLEKLGWVTIVDHRRISDDRQAISAALQELLETCDVVILTGGVSAGDTDFVPGVICELGGQIAFHKLPIRPGKPVLGARCGNKVIFGLPGNPVSAAVTARVIAQTVLERMVGRRPRPNLMLSLNNPDDKKLPLIWYRLITVDGPTACLVENRGSGDLVSMSRSQGFIEQPIGAAGAGPWKAWLW
jgi:molybdopterin molybdotransferase